MGVSVHYCAIPPSSALFRRLQSEQPFATLMRRFFHCGGGIFSFFDEPSRFDDLIADKDRLEQLVADALAQAPPEHREGARRQFEQVDLRALGALMRQAHEEAFQEIIDNERAVLGPEPEARRWINEFRLELARTRSAHTGIEERECWLEKTYGVIEERLQDQFVPARGTGTSRFVSMLMFGDQKLAPDLPLPAGDRLGLVSPVFVREGAQALLALDPDTLFARDGEGCREDFRRWQSLYRAAAAEGEALLVG